MQALAKQLADVFDFVLRFDDAKVSPFTNHNNTSLLHLASLYFIFYAFIFVLLFVWCDGTILSNLIFLHPSLINQSI